ncbi:Spermatogenesis-defective protein 39-like protein [Hypsibius exemplaris]|uniref:Spermatogenesis-defective protein 39-like protein n=1 Tax=Hypsibius exemplaris TaxID=2072580 RepID=A0A9X6NIU3_HYPEX|nr:Spermatogenesis-defective protein 39-like protein [Hypsibius exemplaris]
MADDEDYWNSTLTAKPFDFDAIDDSNGGGSVSRLFGVSHQGAASKRHDELSIPDDVRSVTSEESPSVRSDFGDEDIPPRAPSQTTSLASRTSSHLMGSSPPAVETITSSVVATVSPPSSTTSTAGQSIKRALAKTLHPSLSSTSTPTTNELAFRPRLGSSSSSHHSQLSAEVQYLKRNLEVSRKDQWIRITPREMVWRIMRNKPFSLENYRSIEEKVALLDQALNLHDTNAILIAILHLKNTLSLALFVEEMAKKPDAVDQYLEYLKEDGCYQECLDFLERLGRTDQVAFLQFEMALLSPDIVTQIKDLDLAVRRQPLPTATRPSDLPHIKKYRSLLEIQRPIEEHDEKAARDPRNEAFAQHPRKSILGLSLVQTLFYCCLYHFDKPETSFCSPLFLRKTFAITEKQFLWTALSALAKTQKWTEIQALLTDKTSWFGQPKPKAVIGFDRVVDTLLRSGTPPDVLAYYLRLIEDPEVRLQYSLRCKCHSVIIDTFAALKDFEKLQEYAGRFDSGSDEYRYCQQILQKVTVR